MSDTVDSPVSVFDAWAEVYDAQENPLLVLERRMLAPLLPDIRGLDVVDAGCGTGRWLKHFAERSPRNLIGIDSSSAMLAMANRKVGGLCSLKPGNCAALPIADESADLLLSSFVLSYVDDLEACADEMARVLRPGGSFYVSDMHPATEALLGWKRSFSREGAETSIESRNWSLDCLIETFEKRGFRLIMRCEPFFGLEERSIFALRGRSASAYAFWASASSHPAIYILNWRKPASAPRLRRPVNKESLVLSGARCALGSERAEDATLTIVNDHIQDRVRTVNARVWNAGAEADLDLSGCLLLPGLINAHDHLEFGLFPRLGNGPYRNAGQWASDIHLTHADEIARYRTVPRPTALWWGAIRNLLCGATTVCHHNPLSSEMTQREFPVRVVKDFDWAHSAAFEPHLAEKLAANQPDLPFIIHAAEGVDEPSIREVPLLDQMHAIDHRTLLVHGLACDQEAVALINRRLATVILCPTSNQFLFARSPSIGWVRSLQSVILGSDSPLTAAGDLLDEIRFAHQQIGIDAATLYGMVTTGAARALRLKCGQGTLAPGSFADILVVRDKGLTPADTLVQMTLDQIELVILGGRVQSASPAFMRRLPYALAENLEPLEVDGHVRYVRAPVRELLATAEQFLGEGLQIGGKRVRHVSAA